MDKNATIPYFKELIKVGIKLDMYVILPLQLQVLMFAVAKNESIRNYLNSLITFFTNKKYINVSQS